MPLMIETDIPNTTDETNNEHYTLAVLCLACGVPTIETDAHLVTLVSRAILLDIMPRWKGNAMTADEFVTWTRKFGRVTTNASKRTAADVLKSALLNAEGIAASAVKNIPSHA